MAENSERTDVSLIKCQTKSSKYVVWLSILIENHNFGTAKFE